MSEQMGPTRKIAEFVHNTTFKDIPSKAIEGAKLNILDTVGIGLVALEQPVAQAIQTYVQSLGGEPVATVMGMKGYKTSPPMAALANGCLFNMLDFDNHTATFILPTVLAVGEMLGASGEQVMEAYVLAHEASSQLDHTVAGRSAAFGGPTYRGWYHVSILAPLGAALAASKLLGLDVTQTQEAMGTAACSSGGVRKNMGTKAKSLFSGNSASAGVAAALLAKAGVSGDPAVLEGRGGIVATACLPGEFDWAPVMEHLGDPYLLAGGVGMKQYPVVGPMGGMIATLAQLRQANGFVVSDLVRIEARLTPKAAKSTPIPDPLTDSATTTPTLGLSNYPNDEHGAQFSWSYGMAATLVDGTFTVDHLTEASIRRPEIRDLAAKIEFIPLGTWDDGPESVTLHFRDGHEVTTQTRRPRHSPQREDFAAKFRACAGRRLSADQVEDLYQRVMGLEKLAAISEFTTALA